MLMVLVAFSALGMADGDPVPWPSGASPSSTEVAEQTEDALRLFEKERTEEWLEAFDIGEDSEHIFVLQEDIDAGLYGTERLFNIGDGIFEHEFRPFDGYADTGTEGGNNPTLRRIHKDMRGGLDTFSCAGCHFVGGPNGAGTATQSAFLLGDGDDQGSAVVRNAPHVLGLGLVQALAAEMTSELVFARDQASAQAIAQDQPVTVALEGRGVSFGSLTALADGSFDLSEVEGVSSDLVVRPFGWKGDIARLRRFVEDAARIHFGIQSHPLAVAHQLDPDPEHLGTGPDWFDPDGDGKQRELEEGALTATAIYLALLQVPVILPPNDPGLQQRWARGSVVFDEVGCADCHRRTLGLNFVNWEEHSDTTDRDPIMINLLAEGEEPRGGQQVELFSDLKRHDMGPDLADKTDHPMGIGKEEFLTRPLWGLAETAPFLHDGRAGTIIEAILAHGGEAQASRDAFATLEPSDQQSLHVFLLSLSRTPKVRVQR